MKPVFLSKNLSHSQPFKARSLPAKEEGTGDRAWAGAGVPLIEKEGLVGVGRALFTLSLPKGCSVTAAWVPCPQAGHTGPGDP